MEFDWDEANVEHIAEHKISPDEAEDALLDPNRVRRDAYSPPHEKRRAIVGATEDGRILFVVYTAREGATRIVTARDANNAEKRAYRRQ